MLQMRAAQALLQHNLTFRASSWPCANQAAELLLFRPPLVWSVRSLHLSPPNSTFKILNASTYLPAAKSLSSASSAPIMSGKAATRKRKAPTPESSASVYEGVSNDDSDGSLPAKAAGAAMKRAAAGGSVVTPIAPPNLTGVLVNPKRVRALKDGIVGKGPVIYWMSRDQRMADNWALLHALEVAEKTGSPVAVCFNLVTSFLHAGARQFGFLLRGLKQLPPKLAEKNIAFYLLEGDPVVNVPKLVSDTGAALLVTDFGPLRLGRLWRDEVASKLPAAVPFHEVDAHNVVPAWVASDKRETGARTIRPKIHRHLPEFLREFPPLPVAPLPWPSAAAAPLLTAAALAARFDAVLAEALERGAAVPEVTWVEPGEEAAAAALAGPAGFLSPQRLAAYSEKRNDPCAGALSNLSPYLHYGQLAPQRAALAAAKYRSNPKFKASVEGFLEELVVRRELAENFCHYAKDTYDNVGCAAAWAIDSLEKHRPDVREHLYSKEMLEVGKTHDELWNACQLEMVHAGKMHGFMRMYWAKKILEWTTGPEEAMEIAIYLNDKYEIDGRDPNGYTGIAWSMCGVHDQGWGERAIFGKIRYMNYAGCKRKFNIAKYVANVDKIIASARQSRGLDGAAGGPSAVANGAGSPARKAVAAPAAAAAAAVGSKPIVNGPANATTVAPQPGG